MKKWQKLNKGDVVDLVAPAYGVNEEDLSEAKKYVESLGLIPRTPANIHGSDLFHSNSDEARLKYLKYALYSEDSKAIWCLKGGYGTARLIPELMKLNPPNKAKLVIGFSDITALHLFLSQEWGWASLHGPVLWQVAKGKIRQESLKRLKKIMFGKEDSQIFELSKLNKISGEEIKSSVIGGNLTLLQSSIGTSWQLDAKNKILLIEEVDEEAYRVDRMLLHMMQAGSFKGVSAIIIGDFNSENKKLDEERMEKVHLRFAAQFKIPVLRISGVGHTKLNHPLPFGTKAILKLGAKPSLVCESGYELR